jgi:hypothetical protein
MLSFSGSLKIFVLVEPCDMRKGFNGLYGMVSRWDPSGKPDSPFLSVIEAIEAVLLAGG